MTESYSDKQQKDSDDLLAEVLIRDAASRSNAATARRIASITALLLLLGSQLARHGQINPGVAIFVFGPMVVAVGTWAICSAQVRRANAAFRTLPIWERHRINLVLGRLAQKREKKVS